MVWSGEMIFVVSSDLSHLQEFEMLLIGSRALNFKAKLTERDPLDWDFVAAFEEFTAWYSDFKKKKIKHECYPISSKKYVVKTPEAIYEFDIAWPGTTDHDLLSLIQSRPELTSAKTPSYHVASLDLLYALKMSHRYKKNSPHFNKTMDDIRLMRSLGAKIPKSLKSWMREREKETYNYSHPNLNQSKADFFTDNVPYIYDHDTIHEAVKTFERPAYTYFIEDGEEVKCSKKKFFELPEEIRLAAVLEESYVLALERSQIPYGATTTPEASFKMALDKVCTSITSGWFREYAWENYETVMSMRGDYVDLFNKGLQAGIVKKL